MMKKTFNHHSVGGGSNTPLTDTYINTRTLDKRVLIDWLSVTFDFVDVIETSSRHYQLDILNPLLSQLVKYFGYYGSLYDLPRCQAVRGYVEGIQLGEFVKMFYGGSHTMNSNNKYSINLILGGQACREFENYMNGNWHDLLEFLLVNNATFKRIDIAIDDFDGLEYDIYDLLPIVDKGYYVSPLAKFDLRKSGRNLSRNELISVSEGFTITLGSEGSTQLQIYDKKLERKAKQQIDLDTDIWYRYEMRFVDDKALQVASMYLLAIKENNSPEFMIYASQLLLTTFDVKKRNFKDSNKSRWKTDPKWKNFLNAVSKIDINTKHRVVPTMIKKKLWFNDSMAKLSAELYAYENKNDFYMAHTKTLIKGFENLDEKNLHRINNGRLARGQSMLTFEDLNIIRLELMDSIKFDEEERDELNDVIIHND